MAGGTQKARAYLSNYERRQAVLDEIARERAQQREYSRSGKQVLDRVGQGGIAGTMVGMASGGPPGAVAGGAIGAGVGLLGGMAEYQTGDPITGDVVEFVTDPILGASRSGARLAQQLPKGLYGRARGELEALDMGATPPRGPTAFGNIGKLVQAGYGKARARTNAAYERWRAATTGATVTPKEVEYQLRKAWVSTGRGTGPVDPVIVAAGKEERPYTAEELDVIRREFVSKRKVAERAGDEALARRIGRVLEEFDELEDTLSLRAEGGEEARRLLLEAREQRKAQGYYERGEQGLGGRDTTVAKSFLDPATAPDDPERALLAVMRDKRPLQALRQMRKAAEEVDRLEDLNRNLEGAFLDYVFTRGARLTGPVHKGPVLAGKIGSNRVLGEAILGKPRYQRLLSLAEEVASAEGAYSTSTSRVFVRDLMNWAQSGGLAGAAAGTVAGATGGVVPASAGLVGGALAGTLFAAIAEQFGPAAARRVALESFTDRALLRKLARKRAPQEARKFAFDLMNSLSRRGVVKFQDLVGLERRPEDRTPELERELERLSAPQITE